MSVPSRSDAESLVLSSTRLSRIFFSEDKPDMVICPLICNGLVDEVVSEKGQFVLLE